MHDLIHAITYLEGDSHLNRQPMLRLQIGVIWSRGRTRLVRRAAELELRSLESVVLTDALKSSKIVTTF